MSNKVTIECINWNETKNPQIPTFQVFNLSSTVAITCNVHY